MRRSSTRSGRRGSAASPASDQAASDHRVSALLAAAAFQRGASTRARLAPDAGAEVAFAGRSNSGKSTALNAVTGRGGLARTSKTPGRTQQINFFRLDDDRRLVDLPGYGYASAPEAVRRHWAGLVEDYLRHRQSLRGVVQLMDARRPLAPADRAFLDTCVRAGRPVAVVLAKVDKLSRGAAARALAKVRAETAEIPGVADVLAISAVRGAGLEALRARIGAWLDLG